MEPDDKTGVVCALCCFVFPPFILQTVGLFTPYWVSNSACDSLGLVYSCCSGDNNDTCANTDGGDELDVRVLGLEATAFAVMFLAVFGTCCESCCNRDNDDTGWCGVLGGCCLAMFPVAGLFSFIGCMLIAGNYSTSNLGWSFYLCLVAGCLVLLFTICMCYCFCKDLGKEDSDNRPLVRQSPSRDVYNYGGQAPQVVVSTVEQRAVVHDEESGSIFVIMRKINIAHMVHNMRRSDRY